MTTTLTNLTDSELTDRAAELRKALAATEAEIDEGDARRLTERINSPITRKDATA